MKMFIIRGISALGGALGLVEQTTTTPDYVDVSFISEIADAIPEVFEIIGEPPVNILFGIGLIGLVVGLVKTFMHR